MGVAGVIQYLAGKKPPCHSTQWKPVADPCSMRLTAVDASAVMEDVGFHLCTQCKSPGILDHFLLGLCEVEMGESSSDLQF